MNDLDLIRELLADPTVLTVEAARMLPPDDQDRTPAPTLGSTLHPVPWCPVVPCESAGRRGNPVKTPWK